MRKPKFLSASALAFAAATLLDITTAAQSPVTERMSQCSLVWVGKEDAIETFLAEGIDHSRAFTDRKDLKGMAIPETSRATSSLPLLTDNRRHAARRPGLTTHPPGFVDYRKAFSRRGTYGAGQAG